MEGKTESVHNLVAEAFIGPRPGREYRVDHIDDNKLNNTPTNLRWVHHGTNTKKSGRCGGRRIFYEGEIWLIHRLINARIPYEIIGKLFRCSTYPICEVRKGLR
jgi:hypothetical protein